MFTGLIQETGRIERIAPRNEAARIVVRAEAMAPDLTVGESVAVNGACLTVEETSGATFTVFASRETLSLTTLGHAAAGALVNLERALRLGDRLGGHMVSGHVDATGEIRALEPMDEGWLLRVAAPREILAGSVRKGSITVDGISLTIVDLSESDFTVAVIPQTYQDTNLHERRAGDAVNLESDLVGKYVLRAVDAYRGNGATDNATMMGLLERSGFLE